jgi:catechol 2,3-dioxygenase-like lactoylglutathione lyase family enzyme
MARGIDHIVHAVRDLDAAAEFYRNLGFTVGARNRHSWGTHNHIVQFPGSFIEILTLAEPEKLGDDGFSKLFGAYNGAFLNRGEGLSLLILESKDATADAKAFHDAGIAASDVMRFEREGKRPDGNTVKVAFSLAFAGDPQTPDIHFAVCQQHYPENFWNPELQRHENGAAGIAGVAIVANDPMQLHDFLLKFTGAKGATAAGDNLSIATDRGEIGVMTPVAFTARFGMRPPATERGPRLAALRLKVGETVAAAEKALQQAEIPAVNTGDGLAIGGSNALGATLVFEALDG